MNDEFFWQVFADTGDPLCWLMHRAAENIIIKTGRRMTSCPEGEQGTYVQDHKGTDTQRS